MVLAPAAAAEALRAQGALARRLAGAGLRLRLDLDLLLRRDLALRLRLDLDLLDLAPRLALLDAAEDPHLRLRGRRRRRRNVGRHRDAALARVVDLLGLRERVLVTDVLALVRLDRVVQIVRPGRVADLEL